MAKTALASRSLGGSRTPHEVKQLRRSSFEMHESLGFPVIHKHRWNQQDLAEGRVQQCPLHDDLYDSDLTFDSICFGTGYVGGFSDPTIVFVTLQDAPINTVKIGAQGVLTMDVHPALTAPWTPELGDGDLIILADFVPGTWNVVNVYDRYELREVQSVTMRGPGFSFSPESIHNRLRISQQSQVDKLPYAHPFYNVPLIFDPSTVPADLTPDTPESYTPSTATYSESASYPIRIVGDESSLVSSMSMGVRIGVATSIGTETETEYGVRITGIGSGTVIHLD